MEERVKLCPSFSILNLRLLGKENLQENNSDCGFMKLLYLRYFNSII